MTDHAEHLVAAPPVPVNKDHHQDETAVECDDDYVVEERPSVVLQNSRYTQTDGMFATCNSYFKLLHFCEDGDLRFPPLPFEPLKLLAPTVRITSSTVGTSTDELPPPAPEYYPPPAQVSQLTNLD